MRLLLRLLGSLLVSCASCAFGQARLHVGSSTSDRRRRKASGGFMESVGEFETIFQSFRGLLPIKVVLLSNNTRVVFVSDLAALVFGLGKLIGVVIFPLRDLNRKIFDPVPKGIKMILDRHAPFACSRRLI